MEDSRGLAVDADLDDEDPDVQLLSRKMNGGLIDQMSFAFRASRQEWDLDYTERRILEADIHRADVSVVNQGANPSTFASVRSLRDGIISAGDRSTRRDRRDLAEIIGKGVILEVRSVTLGHRRYDLGHGAEQRAHYSSDDKALRDRIAQLEAEAGQRDWRERLPVFDASAERARLEALRYPQKPAA